MILDFEFDVVILHSSSIIELLTIHIYNIIRVVTAVSQLKTLKIDTIKTSHKKPLFFLTEKCLLKIIIVCNLLILCVCFYLRALLASLVYPCRFLDKSGFSIRLFVYCLHCNYTHLKRRTTSFTVCTIHYCCCWILRNLIIVSACGLLRLTAVHGPSYVRSGRGSGKRFIFIHKSSKKTTFYQRHELLMNSIVLT